MGSLPCDRRILLYTAPPYRLASGIHRTLGSRPDAGVRIPGSLALAEFLGGLPLFLRAKEPMVLLTSKLLILTYSCSRWPTPFLFSGRRFLSGSASEIDSGDASSL